MRPSPECFKIPFEERRQKSKAFFKNSAAPKIRIKSEKASKFSLYMFLVFLDEIMHISEMLRKNQAAFVLPIVYQLKYLDYKKVNCMLISFINVKKISLNSF